jgi:hypothetical protein
MSCRRRSVGTFRTRAAANKALATVVANVRRPRSKRFGEYLEQRVTDRILVVNPTTATKDRNLIRRYVLSHSIARVKSASLEPGGLPAPVP